MSASASVQSLDATLRGARADETFARRYEVDNLRVLGRGAMGSVAAAYDRLAGRWVAVKVFHNPTHEVRERLQSEVLNAERIHSDYVVRVRTPHTSADGELVWLEMELVEGVNLDQELEAHAGDGIPRERAFALAIAITEAIAAAHAAGVIHRDVKPENILVPASGNPLVKVADFGISRHDEQVLMTKSGSLMGTPIYAPPETFRGETLGNPADIYSLGLVFYRVFGRNNLPYDLRGCSLVKVGEIHKDKTPAKLRQFNPDASLDLENLLLRMVAKETHLRPLITEVLSQLQRIAATARAAPEALQPTNTAQAAAVANSPRTPHWARRLALPAGIATLLLLAVLALVSREPQRPAAAPNASAPPPASPAATPVVPPPVIRVEKDDLGNIVLVNTGPERVLVVQVVLEGTGSVRYTAKPGEHLEPSATLGLTLEAFDPVPSRDISGDLIVTVATVNGTTATHRYSWPPLPLALRLDDRWQALTKGSDHLERMSTILAPAIMVLRSC